ncbi:MAG: hypothetical protein FJ399_20965, partial [Verrucomicrobia bacterium]|nr:hypothetical protein [Verrucomicrobiota bacterium]
MPADGPTLRREFLGLVPALAATGLLRAAAGRRRARVGLCTFSCHQHWRAVGAKQPGVRFADTVGFFRYARELGAQGVQTGLRSRDPAVARRLRAAVEETHGTYEGELRLPKTANEVADFEREVQLTCEAGATIARAVFTGGRRYEIFKTLEEFRRFSSEAGASLALAEPVLRRHRLQVAMENHKDFTTEELLE